MAAGGRNRFVDLIVSRVFRRVPITQQEYDEVMDKTLAALTALESHGEDGIIRARSLLYEIHDRLW